MWQILQSLIVSDCLHPATASLRINQVTFAISVSTIDRLIQILVHQAEENALEEMPPRLRFSARVTSRAHEPSQTSTRRFGPGRQTDGSPS
jgi:hypothetical protein